MADDATNPAAPAPATISAVPTPAELIDIMEQVFNSCVIPTPDEAAKIKDFADRMTREGRGATLDFSDPANSGMLGII